jgi:superoxide dismutase, Fe-Mn family
MKEKIMMTRRQAIRTALLSSAACTSLSVVNLAHAQSAATPSGPFTLPPLPYSFDALEPHIDARTMEIHHDKHHAAYVTNLNKALAEFRDLGNKPIEELLKGLNALPEKVRTAVRNNGGGHYNHTLFWQMMKKDGGGQPKGELAGAIDKAFGSFSGFKEKFTDAATKVFGSGWAWLVSAPKGPLSITSTPNQDTTLSSSMGSKEIAALAKPMMTPLLGLDIWEHAYYLKYQNRRPEYIAAWFNVINWDFVSERFAKTAQK